jgi:tol-pal system protein YbgF
MNIDVKKVRTMMKDHQYMFAALSVSLLATGCATAGGVTSGGGGSSQLSNTVYETHRMVQNMEQNLTGSVSTLARNTAEISARIEQNELETRRLIGMAEQNQRKLDTLQYTLDDLMATLYKEMNLSPPTRVTMPSQPNSNLGTTPLPTTGPPQVSVTPPVTQQPDTIVNTQPPQTTFTPQVGDSAAGDSTTHYRQAQQYYTDADYTMAIKQFGEHMTLFPNSPHAANASYWKAHCSFKMGDYAEAVTGFEGLRTQYPTSEKVPIAMHNEAVAYSRLGNMDRAKALFQQLIREYPDDVATEGARDKLRQIQGLN